MLKISIVMLTTALFAGLLIADPGGSMAVAVARQTTDIAAKADERSGKRIAHYRNLHMASNSVHHPRRGG